jgi:hypothetical protein
MMAAFVPLALALAVFVSCLRWLQYPHIDVTIINETPHPVLDLHLTFAYGERTVERLEPRSVAVTEIQSYGEEDLSLSYRDSQGTLRQGVNLLSSGPPGNRGSLEVHFTNDGVKVVNELYPCPGEIPILGVRRVAPTGYMKVN